MLRCFTVSVCGLALLLGISGCQIYTLDIQQGNVITQEMTNSLHPGMSQQQVRSLLGNPVLINTFRDEELNYVYTFQPSHCPRHTERLTLTFKDDHLQHFTHTGAPSPSLRAA